MTTPPNTESTNNVDTGKKCCMTHCPVTKVYLPRFIPAFLATFVFIAVFEYVVHGVWLLDHYNQTPQLWRSLEDMQQYFVFGFIIQALTAFIIGLIYTRNYENKGPAEGLRFGLLLGLLIGVGSAAAYGWMPISQTLATLWFFTGLAKGIGSGVVFGLIYRDPCCMPTKSCCGDGSCAKGACQCSKDGYKQAGKTGCCP